MTAVSSRVFMRGRRRAALLSAVMLACALLFGVTPSIASADSAVFTPTADSYVDPAQPDANYGSSVTMLMGASATQRSFMRFDLSTLPSGATVTGATLRLSTSSIAPVAGFQVYALANDNWDESTITANTAPDFSSEPLAASGGYSIPGYQSVALPVSSISPGLVSFGATTWSGYTKTFQTRESLEPPELLVTYTVGSSVDATAPAPPLNLLATAGDGQVALSWSPNIEADLSLYRIYRRNTDGTWPASPLATTVTPAYVDLSVTNATTYAYRVTAVDTSGNESAPSATVTATPTATLPSGDPVVVAAGDFQGGSGAGGNAGAVATVMRNQNPTAVLGLGDFQYNYGSLSALLAGFDLNFGPEPAGLWPIIYPTAGPTHDVSGASDTNGGYFQYWGREPFKPYSFDLGSWHIIQLPSAAYRYGVDTAGVLSWLKSDLAASTEPCTLAFWHEPYWTRPTTAHTRTTAVKPWVQALYDAGAELILSGHQHDYQRFAPQNPSDGLDLARGIREFVVGTGGIGLYPFTGSAPNVEVSDDATHGALRLTLHPDGYDWQFVPVAGQTFTDSGSGTCH